MKVLYVSPGKDSKINIENSLDNSIFNKNLLSVNEIDNNVYKLNNEIIFNKFNVKNIKNNGLKNINYNPNVNKTTFNNMIKTEYGNNISNYKDYKSKYSYNNIEGLEKIDNDYNLMGKSKSIISIKNNFNNDNKLNNTIKQLPIKKHTNKTNKNNDSDVLFLKDNQYNIINNNSNVFENNRKLSSILNKDVNDRLSSKVNISSFNKINKINKKDINCRICLLPNNKDDSENPLISGCKCKGTMKFIHIECLKLWLKSKIVSKDVSSILKIHSYDTLKCELCNHEYTKSINFNNKIIDLISYEYPEKDGIVLEQISEKGKVHIVIINMNNNNKISFGRSIDCEVRFLDVSISRYHAELYKENNGYTLIDCNSKFGTLINFNNFMEINYNNSLSLLFNNIKICLTIEKTILYYIFCCYGKYKSRFNDYNRFKDYISNCNKYVNKNDIDNFMKNNSYIKDNIDNNKSESVINNNIINNNFNIHLDNWYNYSYKNLPQTIKLFSDSFSDISNKKYNVNRKINYNYYHKNQSNNSLNNNSISSNKHSSNSVNSSKISQNKIDNNNNNNNDNFNQIKLTNINNIDINTINNSKEMYNYKNEGNNRNIIRLSRNSIKSRFQNNSKSHSIIKN